MRPISRLTLTHARIMYVKARVNYAWIKPLQIAVYQYKRRVSHFTLQNFFVRQTNRKRLFHIIVSDGKYVFFITAKGGYHLNDAI